MYLNKLCIFASHTRHLSHFNYVSTGTFPNKRPALVGSFGAIKLHNLFAEISTLQKSARRFSLHAFCSIAGIDIEIE